MAFPVGPRHFLYLDTLAMATINPPHAVVKEDVKAIKRDMFKMPRLLVIVDAPWSVTLRTDRLAVLPGLDIDHQRGCAIDLIDFSIGINETLEFLHPVK